MIPKIVHIIKNKKDIDNIYLSEWQLINKSWDFIFWDNVAIKNKMAKFPKILLLYNYFHSLPEYSFIICPLLACYILLNEYGGLFTTFSSFLIPQKLDDIFIAHRPLAIFIASEKQKIFLFPTTYTYYPTEGVAMEKEHPIWQTKVFPFLNRKQSELAAALKSSTTSPLLQVVPLSYTRKTCATAINNAFLNVLYSYPIIKMEYKTEFSIINIVRAENSVFHTRAKQFILLVVVFIIIFLVEKLYHYNVNIFGTINVLPGIGVVSSNFKKKIIKKK